MGGLLTVVTGGQYGSEGKGAICGYLSRCEPQPLMTIRVAGPNAGHTVYDDDGRCFKLRCIPVSAVTDDDGPVALAAGSEVDMAVLAEEIDLLEETGHSVMGRLMIDPSATVLTDAHRDCEAVGQLVRKLGSTGKGVGAARSERIMRNALTIDQLRGNALLARQGIDICPVAEEAHKWLHRGWSVMVEGTQGYGLGLHAGFYPFCTSSDCRAVDFLSMAGLSPWSASVGELQVWVVMRTYPIRVAGNSGPLGDELSWESLASSSHGHIQPERTTVTNKIRRVGGWDLGLAKAAIAANGGPGWPVQIALTMFDYLWPELSDSTDLREWSKQQHAFLGQLEDSLGTRVNLLGTGPRTVIDRRQHKVSTNGRVAHA